MISKKQTPFYFYLGTLLSSVGSMTLVVSLLAFMLKNQFSLLQISVIIGLSRFLPVVVSVFLGHKTDSLSPKKIIVFAEIGAATASLFLFYSWEVLDKNYYFILIAMILRSLFTSIQNGSKAQIAKVLSDSSYQSNSKNAVWLNKATQGATLFAGVLGWFAITRLSLSAVIIFDAITFILNGLILFMLPIEGAQSEESNGSSIVQKFKDFYQYNFKAGALDALLVLSMMGTSAFTARLAGAKEEWISLFLLSYGLAVWLAGYLERTQFIKNLRSALWIMLGVSLILLGMIPGPNALVWAVCLFKDICFWILFHRISSYIQIDTPQKIIGSVNHARNAQMITIFALGEIAVGLWKNSLPFLWECGLRGGLCLAVALVIALNFKKVENYDRAHL